MNNNNTMRLKHVKGAEERIETSEYVVDDEEARAGTWRERFGNDHPIHLEIGMGKGRFLLELATRNPDINYVGIERYSSVLIRAIQKREQEEYKDLTNIYFICTDAQNIQKIFAKDEIDRIYLNFSDPWPKERHAKRRLTSRRYLRRYEDILKRDGVIEFKTDNTVLFQFSLEEVEAAGWELLASTTDLRNDPVLSAGNVMTEYEEKFSAKGVAVCKLIARQRQKNGQ